MTSQSAVGARGKGKEKEKEVVRTLCIVVFIVVLPPLSPNCRPVERLKAKTVSPAVLGGHNDGGGGKVSSKHLPSSSMTREASWRHLPVLTPELADSANAGRERGAGCLDVLASERGYL
jgi:hypothetical protein